ncbi:MAG: MMPL family transporter, partial [Actinomycetota bacterium]
MARPRVVLWSAVLLAVLAGLLSLGVETDTDPENMLPPDHEVRVRNAEMRDTFSAHEMVVVGIVDEDGIGTPERLGGVADLRSEIDAVDGVRAGEIVSFASVGAAAGDIDSEAGVEALVEAVAVDPALAGNVLSEDGTTAALFVPLQHKSDANPVAAAIDESIDRTDGLAGTETYVAGLPLAEEAFGEQMFVQMAVFAPLAGLLIFLLMLWFFRKVSLVLAAMAVALLSVVWTMGALIGSGNSLHIMSSMIPIFLIPIAILDSVHVLSEFFDRYPHHLDRRATLRVVYAELYRPLTYTSVTTGVAFASLALAPIPPIRTFGLFVAFGVFTAWLLS